MIYQIIVPSLIVASVLAAPTKDVPLEQQQPTVIPIVSQSEEVELNGTFKFSYETGNGIKREEISYDKVIPKPVSHSADSEEGGESDDSDEIHVQRGSYSYTAPDGTIITLRYIADENGFQPIGSHLPRAPASVPVSSASSEKSGRALKQEDNSESGSEPLFKNAIPGIVPHLGNEPKLSFSAMAVSTASVLKSRDKSVTNEEVTKPLQSNKKEMAPTASATTQPEIKLETPQSMANPVKSDVNTVTTVDKSSTVPLLPNKKKEKAETTTPQSELKTEAKGDSQTEKSESSTQDLSEEKVSDILTLSKSTATLDEITTEKSSEETLVSATTEEPNLLKKSAVNKDRATANTISITVPAEIEITTAIAKDITEQPTSTNAPTSEDVSTSAPAA